ncbi:uncharacterized protein [Linepithema humile]|uniref:uncharacterized protein n=1 Tax=Linepithema humile TaxID=83485 RepID=UPI00351E4989
MEGKTDDPSLIQNQERSAREKYSKERIAMIVNKDSCRKDKVKGMEDFRLPADDPRYLENVMLLDVISYRFQQQNQTARCFVMYTDFYRCEHILGKNAEACTWFKEVFTTICPNAWVERWDELRVTGRLPWHKHRTQGAFPGCKYGE